MEFTLTFTEIINQIVDLSLLGMESFIGLWLCAAFLASAYPEFTTSSSTEPITPVTAVQEPVATKLVSDIATALETTSIVPSTDITGTVTSLSYKSLRNILRILGIKYYGMNKESMITTLLSKITEEELDISPLLATA